MPWEFKRDKLPVWHDHPLKMPKKLREQLAPLMLVTRKQWGALPNNDEEPMELPVNYVRHVHTETDQCTTKEECVKLIRDTQIKHMREGLADINWNFLIGGDGRVYEGRGWELDSTRDFEKWQAIEAECIDIGYIGTYDKKGEEVPEIMRRQAAALIVYGLDKKYIHCCYQDIPFQLEEFRFEARDV